MEALKIEGLIGTLRSDDGDGNENVKKAIGLDWQNNNFAGATHNTQHTFFLYIPLPSLHDYDVKMPNVTFYEGRKQASTKFSFSF